MIFFTLSFIKELIREIFQIINFSFLCFPLFEIWIRQNLFSEVVQKVLEHLQHKNNVVTMGGVLFWLIFASWGFSSGFMRFDYLMIISYFTLIGFIDDIQKINNGVGISVKLSYLLQVIGGIMVAYTNFADGHTSVLVPFFNCIIDLKIWYIPLVSIFIVPGLVNGINLTDGLNGGLTIPVLILNFTMLHFFGYGYGGLSPNLMSNEIPAFLYPLSSILIAFLFFNMRQQLFMANVGSYFIAGVYCIALINCLKLELFIPFFCLLFFLEVLSVIIQLTFRRLFNIKIFKFSPFHHHLELSGYSNNRILVIFP